MMDDEVTTLSAADIYFPIDFLAHALKLAQNAENRSFSWKGKLRFGKSSTSETVCLSTAKHEHFLKLHTEKICFTLTNNIYSSVIYDIRQECLDAPPKLTHVSPSSEETSQTVSDIGPTTTTVELSMPDLNTTDGSVPDDQNKDSVDIQTEEASQSLKVTKISGKSPNRKRQKSVPKKNYGKRGKYTKQLSYLKDSQAMECGIVSNDSESVATLGSPKERYSLRGKKIDPKIINAEKGIYEHDSENASVSGSMQVNECIEKSMPNSDRSKLNDKEQSVNKKDSTKENNENSAPYLPKKIISADIKTKCKQKQPLNKMCKMCSYVSSDYSRLFSHVTKKHEHEEGVKDYIKELQTLKVAKCETCNREFPNESKLHVHEKMEHSIATCDLCHQVFKNAITLRNHVRNIHERTEVTAAICEVCSATFKSVASLKQHCDSVHKEMKCYPCLLCDKKFHNGSQLRRHIRVHGLDEAKRLKCDICSKSFLYKHNLQRHVELIHSAHHKMEKFHCSYCGKGYTQKLNMISHVQHVHFNIFPYSCKMCKTTFTKSHFLLEHMMSVHKQTGVKIPESPRNQVYGKEEEDKFYCAYCNEGFVHKIRLIEHMHFDHSKAFPFLCELCNQGFLSRTFLALHSLKAHRILMTDDGDLPVNTIGSGDILQIISTKSGQPSTVVKSPATDTDQADGVS